MGQARVQLTIHIQEVWYVGHASSLTGPSAVRVRKALAKPVERLAAVRVRLACDVP